ncbi:release factor glutamine methyltransferase [Enhydrobacter aerosaccus]|uniref:Release factor glutamine methyltransferase n=1 Tax=Enhydrobacter aerosaccus TaxID=225324 RepID=A0A1T4T282_9HYPH|nr:50S ribosomal protein L11 methyltransferase [Enhydrobacter aerosaccus]SKA34248.1 release factor glutamine methyltransferase [Enhydrobacter aerosaccus]
MTNTVPLLSSRTISTLRPSEYTGALIQALRTAPERIAGAAVIEIGSGSGVILAAMASLGAASLCGVDIEHEAVLAGAELLASLGYGDVSRFHHGNLWEPVQGQRFDLVVANLPHFPMARGKVPGRRPSWSSGGIDGRRLLDPFLDGLGDHLAGRGRAIITHNGFVCLDRSREILRRHGLGAEVIFTTLVHLPPEKMELMTDSVLAAEEGRTILRYGPYAFGEMHIVEIAALQTPG